MYFEIKSSINIRARWQALGNMTTTEAQDTFVQTLLQICPQFGAQLEVNDTNSSENGFEVYVTFIINSSCIYFFIIFSAQFVNL